MTHVSIKTKGWLASIIAVGALAVAGVTAATDSLADDWPSDNGQSAKRIAHFANTTADAGRKQPHGDDIPDIDVSPLKIMRSGESGGTPVFASINISNPGWGRLRWFDQPTVVWDQANSGTGYVISAYSTLDDEGVYVANDFTLAGETAIGRIYAAVKLQNAPTGDPPTSINWRIYPDAEGHPAGDPETSPGTAAWSYTAPIDGAGIVIEENEIQLDLSAAGQSLELPAGTYWLSVYLSYPNEVFSGHSPRSAWYQAEVAAEQAQIVSPAIGGALATWQPLSEVGALFDTAFTLARLPSNQSSCGAPWISLSQSAGTIWAGGGETVQVRLDPAGLSVGTHQGSVCIESNDPDEMLILIPVDFEITEAIPVDDIFSAGFECGVNVASCSSECTPLQLLQDPSFEDTDGQTCANPWWDNFDSEFGSACGGGAGAHTGNFFIWFGGRFTANTSWIRQNVVLEAGQQRWLNYWLARQLAGNPTAELTISIDGNLLHDVPLGTEPEYAYRPYTLQIPPEYADGLEHEIRFDFSADAADQWASGAWLDDVTLDCETQSVPRQTLRSIGKQ